ncbi:hydroxyisourate hydrolase [Pigmentiphaga litoralis]|uniref:hydroxyisourate hydrolase n=1 Tax=Pigmentiphaga litoralis TaxID=516702 RepID=UPI003B42D197
MGKLTTHVLDTAHGCPAAGLAIDLYRLTDVADPASAVLLKQVVTNADGRVDGPLLDGADLVPAAYRLVFAAGAYFAARGIDLPEPRFVDRVALDFGIADAGQHFHVPLLVSPWSWSTYRGS